MSLVPLGLCPEVQKILIRVYSFESYLFFSFDLGDGIDLFFAIQFEIGGFGIERWAILLWFYHN